MDDDDLIPLFAAFNVPLTHTQIGWIGQTAILWSQFEFLVERAIYHLRGQSFDEGRATKIDRDITKRLGLLKALAGDKLKGVQRNALIDICERGITAARVRNLALHGQWVADGPGGHVHAISWFKVPVGAPLSQLPFAELPGFAYEVGKIGLALFTLLEERGDIQAWLKRRTLSMAATQE